MSVTFPTSNLSLSTVLAAYGRTGNMNGLRGLYAHNPDGTFITVPPNGNFGLLATFGGRTNQFTGTLPNSAFPVFSSPNMGAGLGLSYILSLFLTNFSYINRGPLLNSIIFTLNVDIAHNFATANAVSTSANITVNGTTSPLSISDGFPVSTPHTVSLNIPVNSTFTITLTSTGVGTYRGDRQINTGPITGTWNFLVGPTGPVVR
jgi:hypothetical protein